MYTIKDVSKQLKVSTGSLKNWEKVFDKFVQIHRTKNGSRIYNDSELVVLKKIKVMKEKNLSDEMVMFILDEKIEDGCEVPEQIQSEYDLKYADIVALQTETVQAVQNISDSLDQFKGNFIKEVKDDLTSEVKKEITKGNSITQGIVQTYSHEVLDTFKATSEHINELKEEIEREQEEKLFLQKKVEEREELFQDFVQSYRQAAAAIEEKNEKRKLSYWLNLLSKAPVKWKKV
ncbi:MerR family transcriptional regulator [Anaerobacillus isosaccharinicus]|uniref:MerR family transcriptional regulator n=1 Tax=Anaerobacillus isosaccharinicus TaxID=1532552 RepID=A0A1S2LII5_9BACI|nr:MerR family transcriptional regulator [Anaerobacillus isosaccharinicus]MBA5586094.1 MerR family transcriptional regulator [Anaerobacillus isosaccharinicus]QOY35637.1 MerR family transcriptional regulator [Anaerobacillus isosaccharinicus]